MSSVVDLRRITTTERLRGDHIATLEVLQATVDENVSLKAEIARIKSGVQGASGCGADDETKEGSGQHPKEEAAAFLVQRMLAADATMATLTNENKVLKSKLASNDIEMRNLKKSCSANEIMKKELDIMLQAQRNKEKEKEEDRKESEAQAQTMRDKALRDQAHEAGSIEVSLQAELHAKAAALEALQAAHESLQHDAAQYRARTELIVANLRGELQQSAKSSEAAAQQLEALEAEMLQRAVMASAAELSMRESARVSQDIEEALQDRLHAATLQVEAERSVIAKLQAQMGDMAKKLEEDQKRSSASTQLSSSASAPAFMTINPPEEEHAGGAGLFEEFVRLKRENKTLKLQLATLAQSQPQSRGR